MDSVVSLDSERLKSLDFSSLTQICLSGLNCPLQNTSIAGEATFEASLILLFALLLRAPIPSALQALQTMIMLTGIKAFEACWTALRTTNATTSAENHLLMQSMGRLVDNYATQSEISSELPAGLRTIFLSLVDAYLNGYWLEEATASPTTFSEQSEPSAPPLSPAQVAAKQRRKHQRKPTVTSEAATYIIHERVACGA